MSTKNWTFVYEIDGYGSPLPKMQLLVRAKTENNALVAGLRAIGHSEVLRHGVLTEAKKYGGRIWLGEASYNRPRHAWIEARRTRETTKSK